MHTPTLITQLPDIKRVIANKLSPSGPSVCDCTHILLSGSYLNNKNLSNNKFTLKGVCDKYVGVNNTVHNIGIR